MVATLRSQVLQVGGCASDLCRVKRLDGAIDQALPERHVALRSVVVALHLVDLLGERVRRGPARDATMPGLAGVRIAEADQRLGADALSRTALADEHGRRPLCGCQRVLCDNAIVSDNCREIVCQNRRADCRRAEGRVMSDDELFAWTSLLSARTGLPVTVWVSAAGLVATDPCDPANVMHRDAVQAWMDLNRTVLAEHWRGAYRRRRDGAAIEAGRDALAPARPRSRPPGAMTSPLLRLFAVSWWLVVIGSAGLALLGTWAGWEHLSEAYTLRRTLADWPPAPPDPSLQVAAGAVVLLFSLLPFIIVAVIRRIMVGRWRFGPRW